MTAALWLRFDIPYAEDASVMRADLGFRDGDSVRRIPIEKQSDIPGTVDTALRVASERKLIVGTDFTLVYPLDSRHGVAWAVKEESDKRSFQFSRHIPSNGMPTPADYPRFADTTGSREDHLSREEARALVVRLNTEAQEFFSTGMDMPDAMSCLRHALQAASKHLGWTDPIMTYSLRNFGYVMRATGNAENLQEFLSLAGILASELGDNSPTPGVWDKEGGNLLEQTAGLCATSGDEPTARQLLGAKTRLGL